MNNYATQMCLLYIVQSLHDCTLYIVYMYIVCVDTYMYMYMYVCLSVHIGKTTEGAVNDYNHN